jgi:hypothetical protein
LPIRRIEAFAGLALVMATACNDPQQIVCSPVGPAVDVTVRDSVTNDPAATGARGAAERSGVIDSLVVLTPERMISEQWATPATYIVRIEKAGYAPWSVTLVSGPGGRCGPAGVHAEARLKPVAQP